MGDHHDERPPAIKIGSLQGYSPLSDTTVTTRGQALPALIQERSSPNIKDLKKRRQIRIEDENEEDHTDLESNADSIENRRDGLSVPDWRRSSIARRQGSMGDVSQILQTPRLRSMRLIGQPNPQYQW